MFQITGCEDYLDKSPDMGLTEDAIYKDYNSITGYIDYMFWNYMVNFFADGEYANGRNYFGAISDEFASMYNDSDIKAVHAGNWLSKDRNNMMDIGSTNNTINNKSYQGIRVANRIIQNSDKIQNCSSDQLNWVLGQAHFYRAWFYFQLITRYGGMPILDRVFTGYGDDDIPRVTYHESHDWMMQDIENAIEMLPEFWDDNNTGRPNKVAAMALKSMSMLYDASPLMQNDLTSTVNRGYDKDRAAKAAVAADEVLKYLSEFPRGGGTPIYRYQMSKAEDYNFIFYFPRGNGANWVHPEYLWYNRRVVGNKSLMIRKFFLFFSTDAFVGPDAASGCMPTQGMVEMYEKKGADGNYYPITDPRSGYNDQDPFTDRDPRFYNNIITPGEAWGLKNGRTFYWTTYEGGVEYNTLLTNASSNQRSQTGYICRKYIWPECNDFTSQYDKNHIITCYIRYAQIYLDLAEASFEATGSATARVPGCSMNAAEALNVVRSRIGVTNVAADIVNNPESFRETLRRERTVELMFENHRWFDIRRWMIMHILCEKPNPLKGLLATPITPLSPSSDQTTNPDNANLKFTFRTVDLQAEIRGYTMKNYWYPFSITEVASLKNLVQNPYW